MENIQLGIEFSIRDEAYIWGTNGAHNLNCTGFDLTLNFLLALQIGVKLCASVTSPGILELQD